MVAVLEPGGRLFALEFMSSGERAPSPGATSWRGITIEWRTAAGPCAAELQIGEYFAGARRSFALELSKRGSDFQRRVWSQLRLVGYGETITYRELAARAGHEGACRAAGSANAANPFAIIVPCHRVVGSSGHLTGYAGGLALKAALIAHERRCNNRVS